MGRPLLPIWRDFETTVPVSESKRRPDVTCRLCHKAIRSARTEQLRTHNDNCPERGLLPHLEQVQRDLKRDSEDESEVEHEATTTVQSAELSVPAIAPAPVRQPTLQTLGKRPRTETQPVERMLRDIRDSMDAVLECKRQEIQLRREELAFQREALASKMEYKRQVTEEERRERREERDADRQERLELARIENEKNLAFLKAVVESQQRR